MLEIRTNLDTGRDLCQNHAILAQVAWFCIKILERLDFWLIQIYESRVFRHLLYTVDVQNPNVRISDIWAVRFVWSFGYTINVRNPNDGLVKSINWTSEIQTVWEWDNFGKRRNLNVRISDTYCILKIHPVGMDFENLMFIFTPFYQRICQYLPLLFF